MSTSSSPHLWAERWGRPALRPGIWGGKYEYTHPHTKKTKAKSVVLFLILIFIRIASVNILLATTIFQVFPRFFVAELSIINGFLNFVLKFGRLHLALGINACVFIALDDYNWHFPSYMTYISGAQPFWIMISPKMSNSCLGLLVTVYGLDWWAVETKSDFFLLRLFHLNEN